MSSRRTHIEDEDELREHILRNASPELKDRAERMDKVRGIHIETANDVEMSKQIKLIIADLLSRNVTEGYALTVTGESGAGKSSIIRHCFDETPAFKSYKNRFGNDVKPLLELQTPAGCTVKALGIAILTAAGYNMVRDLDEGEVWVRVKDFLRKKTYKVIFLDEFQHALEAPTVKGRAHLANTVKALLTDPSYPMWLILSGVPSVLDFIERDPHNQMERRAPVVEIADIDKETGANDVIEIIQYLAVEARLEVALDFKDDFAQRLIHAGIKRFGMIVQLVKFAIIEALWDDEANDILKLHHFVLGYQRLSNCPSNTNVMATENKNWFKIQRSVTTDKLLSEDSGSSDKASKK